MSSDNAGLAAADNAADDADLGHLIIGRYIDQAFSVDGPATVTVLDVLYRRGDRARVMLAITAPRSTIIERDDLKKGRKDAATAD